MMAYLKVNILKLSDHTHQDLKHFQNFLYRHFYKTEYYDKISPISNQRARSFGTAKTHKFNKIEDINIQDLKLRPIIDQTGSYIYIMLPKKKYKLPQVSC